MNKEDNNDETIDQQQQKRQNIDEPKLIANITDSSEAKIQTPQPTQQQIVPILEEDFSISKQTSIKEAKIEKKVITKTRITEKKVIDIDLRGEEVEIKYPDGRAQKLG